MDDVKNKKNTSSQVHRVVCRVRDELPAEKKNHSIYIAPGISGILFISDPCKVRDLLEVKQNFSDKDRVMADMYCDLFG